LTANAIAEWSLMLVDRRSLGRTAISKGALLFLGEQSKVLPCSVQNITNVGARLRLDSLNGVPQAFELSFDKFRNTRKCRVVWLRDDCAGVAFEN
jgi:hypothetical protein